MLRRSHIQKANEGNKKIRGRIEKKNKIKNDLIIVMFNLMVCCVMKSFIHQTFHAIFGKLDCIFVSVFLFHFSRFEWFMVQNLNFDIEWFRILFFWASTNWMMIVDMEIFVYVQQNGILSCPSNGVSKCFLRNETKRNKFNVNCRAGASATSILLFMLLYSWPNTVIFAFRWKRTPKYHWKIDLFIFEYSGF